MGLPSQTSDSPFGFSLPALPTFLFSAETRDPSTGIQGHDFTPSSGFRLDIKQNFLSQQSKGSLISWAQGPVSLNPYWPQPLLALLPEVV